MRNPERRRDKGQPERRTQKEASDALRRQYGLSPKREKREKRRWYQISLAAFLLLLIPVGAGIEGMKQWYTGDAIKKARKRILEEGIALEEGGDLEDDLERIHAILESENNSREGLERIFTDKIGLRQVTDVRELAGRRANILFQEIQRDRFQVNRRPNSELDDNPGNSELVDNIRRQEQILRLAELSELTPSQLLDEEPGQNLLREELKTQGRDMWEEIRQMTTGEAALPRRKRVLVAGPGPAGWHIRSPLGGSDEPYANYWKLPALVMLLDKSLKLGDGQEITKEEIGIDGEKAKNLLRPEIETLWESITTAEGHPEFRWSSNKNTLAQIEILMKFAGLTPDDFPAIGSQAWREAVGTTVRDAFRNTQGSLGTIGPDLCISGWKDIVNLLQLVDPPLKPTDPEINIPLDAWEKVKGPIEDRIKKKEAEEKARQQRLKQQLSPGAFPLQNPGGPDFRIQPESAGADSTIEMQLEIEPRWRNTPDFEQESTPKNTPMEGPDGAAVIKKHPGIVRRVIQVIREKVSPLDVALPSVEAAVTVAIVLGDYNPFAPGAVSGIYLGTKLGVKLGKLIWRAAFPEDKTPKTHG